MNYFNSLLSADFQCPDTGVPVQLEYDDEKCCVTACICDIVWDSWKSEVIYPPEVYEKEEVKTQKWCDNIYHTAFDMDEAQEIAEEYDTWFS